MEIQFSFEKPEGDWHALGCARLLCDIQHLCLFAMYLADEDVLSEFDLFSGYDQKYESMIVADRAGLDRYAVRLVSFNFNSPADILIWLGLDHGNLQKFKVVLGAFRDLIFLKAQQRKLHAQAERDEAHAAREWQKAVGEALKNLERGLKISRKISDPKLRSDFERNLVTALKPLADGRHPPLRRMEITPNVKPRD